MSNAAPPRIQPSIEHTPTPWRVGDRKPYVEIWGPQRMNASPILVTMEHEPREANAAFICEAVNSHASLKARAEQAERSVDVLESNARVQAKLLADTGRRVEELEAALRQVIACDQKESWRTIECDPAGNTMELRTVDGTCARIARAALPQPRDVARAPTDPKQKESF